MGSAGWPLRKPSTIHCSRERRSNKYNCQIPNTKPIESEVLRAMIKTSSISLEFNSMQADMLATCFHVGFILDLLFDPEHGGEMFL
jgi:hypothetical protein